jgi:BirA family biotin operon repressor/biotin-[acetyl-CoA-carboxylase] ligase
MNFTILKFDEIGSTNTEALEQAKGGAVEGLCVVARSQTAGRGRHGRTWISEKDAGLYFSIVLRPKIEVKFLPLLTLMSAVAVYDVLSEIYGLKPDIKWANDVHINGKKICGILAETVETNKGLAVIVGIGINLKSTNFPPEIAEIATSIESETKLSVKFDEVCEALTRFFAYHYDNFDAELIRKNWLIRSSYAFGKDVKVLVGNETIFGKTCGIEENGALRIETETGEIKIIHAGDVEQLRQI